MASQKLNEPVVLRIGAWSWPTKPQLRSEASLTHVERRRAVGQPGRGRDPQLDLAGLVADAEGLVRLALGDAGGELCWRQLLVRHAARVGGRARHGVRARHIQP